MSLINRVIMKCVFNIQCLLGVPPVEGSGLYLYILDVMQYAHVELLVAIVFFSVQLMIIITKISVLKHKVGRSQ